jgi:hypothetical protein
MIRLAGIFNEAVAESYEMLYQNENDCLFDSSKLEINSSFEPTVYEQGNEEINDYFSQNGVIENPRHHGTQRRRARE